MEKKPVILIIENSTHVTGALKSITRTAFDLQSFFSFVFVIPRNSAGRFWIEEKGFAEDIIEVDMREIRKKFASIIFYLPYLVVNGFKLKRIIRDKNVNLVHVNDLYNLLPVMANMLGSRVPYICHIRFLPNRFPRVLFNFWLKVHLKLAERVIPVSNFLRQSLPPSKKIISIPNELPISEKLAPSDDRKKKDGYVFLYLGNYIEGKGQDHALEAFITIHRGLPGWRIRFVGGDMGLEKNRIYQQKLDNKAKLEGLTEKVEWKGFTEDVESEYKDADIVLNFSESESFSITCLEALFFGRPLIASDCGGPAEIIDHHETGLLVPNKDVRAMAEAMLSLASDPELRNRMASEGRIRVRKKFSIDNTSYVLKGVYDRALNKGR